MTSATFFSLLTGTTFKHKLFHLRTALDLLKNSCKESIKKVDA